VRGGGHERVRFLIEKRGKRGERRERRVKMN